MSRHLSNALFLVFLLFFMLLSPWTRANVNFTGLLLSASALMCVISFWYGRSFWQQHWSSFRALFSSPRASFSSPCPSFLIVLFALPLLAVFFAWLLSFVSAGGADFSSRSLTASAMLSTFDLRPSTLLPLLSTSDLPLLTLTFLSFSLELFFRAYIQPSLSLVLPVSASRSWLNPLLTALLTALLAALLFHPSGNLVFVLCVFLLHLPFALLYAFMPSTLFSLLLSHTLFTVSFLYFS